MSFFLIFNLKLVNFEIGYRKLQQWNILASNFIRARFWKNEGQDELGIGKEVESEYSGWVV